MSQPTPRYSPEFGGWLQPFDNAAERERRLAFDRDRDERVIAEHPMTRLEARARAWNREVQDA